VQAQFESAIKKVAGMQLTKAEKIRRAAQSARDKQSKKGGKQKDAHVQAFRNQGRAGARAHASTVQSGVREHDTIAPAAIGRTTTSSFSVSRSPRFKDGIVVEATDHIDFVAQPSPAAVTGQTLLEWYVSPASLGGSRLEKYGALYEKFLFDIMDFELVPAVGSATSGDLGMSYDPDVMDPTPPPSVDGVRQFTGYQFNCDANVWVRQRLSVKPTAPDTGYFTNPVVAGPTDDRLSYQGQLYVYMAVPSNAATGTVLARLRMKYRCHFFSPQLQTLITGAQMTGLSAAAIPAAPTGGDFLALVETALNFVSGNPAFKPKLDSLGKWFIELAQGVYKVSSSLNADGDGSTAPGDGVIYVDTPTIVLNAEPTSAAAPQPWVAETSNLPGYTLTGETWSSASLGNVVGIPRDGAKLYQEFFNPASMSGSTTNYFSQLDIERLGNWVPEYNGLFLALLRGSEQCAQPKKFRELALAAAQKAHPRYFAFRQEVRNKNQTAVPVRSKRERVPSSQLAAQFLPMTASSNTVQPTGY
jgi:hypothetical protein